jgi:hypothetical protein
VPVLEEIVASAVRQRRDVLVELVRVEVDHVLAALVSELVDIELEARRNGAPTSAVVEVESASAGLPGEGEGSGTGMNPSTLTAKVCTLCGLREPQVRFDVRRRQCVRCKARIDRERKARRRAAAREDSSSGSSDGEPHPVPRRASPRRRSRGGGMHMPPGSRELERREERRQQIEDARMNDTRTEHRDGKLFTIIHLPSTPLPGRASTTAPVRSHSQRYGDPDRVTSS